MSGRILLLCRHGVLVENCQKPKGIAFQYDGGKYTLSQATIGKSEIFFTAKASTINGADQGDLE